jgi:hypothetical protein
MAWFVPFDIVIMPVRKSTPDEVMSAAAPPNAFSSDAMAAFASFCTSMVLSVSSYV